MFRKLITNLSFSPSLIGEVSLYDKKLKSEQKLRLIGLILSLIAASFYIYILINPSEAQNQANVSDTIRGGFSNKQDVLNAYDQNQNRFRDLTETLGINRNEILASSLKKINIDSQNNLISTNNAQSGNKDGTIELNTSGTKNFVRPFYFIPVSSSFSPVDSKKATFALVGKSDKRGDFAILRNSGNIVVKSLPKSEIVKNQNLDKSISVNITNQTDSTPTIFKPGDFATITLSAKNKSNKDQIIDLETNLSDIEEYADVTSLNGAIYNQSTKNISWQDVNIPADETVNRNFSIRLKSIFPATSRGISNKNSQDCVAVIAFGDTASIPVKCPVIKVTEMITHRLPDIDKNSAIISTVVIFIIILLLYANTVQKRKEIKIIRQEFNQGSL